MQQHDTILIACTRADHRRQLRFILSERYNLLEASNITQALTLAEQNMYCIAAVIFTTNVIDGEESRLLGDEATRELLGEFPVIIMTERVMPERLSAYFRYGASDVIPLSYGPYPTLRRIENIVDLHLHKSHLESVVAEQADILRRSNDTIVDALSSMIEYRSVESGHHIFRVRNFTRILMENVMRHCPEYELTERQVTIISGAAALHDIGKIAVPDEILKKPGPLSRAEQLLMQEHTVTGCRMLESLSEVADREYLRYAHNICHYHHERWDGSGYPEGLSGDDIPICAQVVGLADAYDALTSSRVYKDAYTNSRAVNMILNGECGEFSPKLLECFKRVTSEFRVLSEEYADGRQPNVPVADMTLPPPEESSKEDSVGVIRAKYHALVHYNNAFLVEVDLDSQLFHVVYNPYPELAKMDGIYTLQQLTELMLDKIVVQEERDTMADLLYVGVPRFVDQDLRRATYRFHYRAADAESSHPMEMTLLRIANTSGRRSLAILVRKLRAESAMEDHQVRYSLAESTYVCRNNREFTLVRMETDRYTLGGYTYDELWDRFDGRLAEIIHPADRQRVWEGFCEQLGVGSDVRLEHRVVLKDGTVMWVANKSRLVVGEDGQEYIHSFLTDITETRSEFERMQYYNRLFGEILTDTQNVLFRWDALTDTAVYSSTYGKLFDHELPRKDVTIWLRQYSYFHPDDVPKMLDSISNMKNGSDYEVVEMRMASTGGQYLWCRFRAKAERDDTGELLRVKGMISNIQPEKEAEMSLMDKADRDSLTGLLNKNAGRKRMESYFSHYPDGAPCAMLAMDLDNFKLVNDYHGHLYGDAVLNRVANELRSEFYEQDLLCRVGGDEFLVLVRGTNDRAQIERHCRNLVESLRAKFAAELPDVNLSCSIGVAMCPEHGVNYYDLFDRADKALYMAKAKGKNTYFVYSPEAVMGAPVTDGTTMRTPIESDRTISLPDNGVMNQAFSPLYSSRDPIKAVNQVIAHFGRYTNVSRVYIFENSSDNRYCSNTFEWCNEGITPEIDNLQHISYEEDIPGYIDNFDERGMFYCPDITRLPKETYEILEPQGVKSMLQCAIRQDGVLRGYIGFDECVNNRMWTKGEIRLLSYVADVLGLFLLQLRDKQRLEEQVRKLEQQLSGLV